MDRDSELALVERLREGDAGTFDEVHLAFNIRVFTFLVRLSRRRDVAEDLLEETWLRFVKHARRLGADTRLGPWLFTVARNLHVSYQRSRALEHSAATGLMALWPLGVLIAIVLRLPVAVVMLSFLPLYAFGLQLLVTVAGLYGFCKEYNYRFPVLLPISMIITFVPFQWLLGISALRAVYREARRAQNWEKTEHSGAHRLPAQVSAPVALERLLDEASA